MCFGRVPATAVAASGTGLSAATPPRAAGAGYPLQFLAQCRVKHQLAIRNEACFLADEFPLVIIAKGVSGSRILALPACGNLIVYFIT